MLNSINLVGRLVGDPELHTSNNNVPFATFTIAVDNTSKEADGTRGTCFLEARAFNAQAENVCKALRKGSKVAISGGLNQKNFTRNDGSKGRVYEVIINSIEFLDPKREDSEKEVTEYDDDAYDSAGSLSGEEYEDEDGKVQKLQAVPPEAKFDPMTGKPLKPKSKK